MSITLPKSHSRDEYLALEDSAEMKHEFYQGQIFAMSGGTFNHAKISSNTLTTLSVKLRDKFCTAMNSDMRVNTPSGLDTYPDISVFCGKPLLTDNQRTLLNPVLLIEVLSPSTRRYDQSDKFVLYRTIPTLSDYLLIDSEKVHVQHFHKIKQGEWLLREYVALTKLVDLNVIAETVSLAEMYESVLFD